MSDPPKASPEPTAPKAPPANSALPPWLLDWLAQWKLSGLLLAVSLGSCLLTHWLSTSLLFTLPWILLLIYLPLNAVWHRWIAKYRNQTRAHLDRELKLERILETREQETAEWLNHILSRFWVIYEPVLGETVVASVNPILEYYKPAFIDSIALTEFTLGTLAPRLVSMKAYHDTEEDTIRFDVEAQFQPLDTEDTSFRWNSKQHHNSKIVLTTRVGRGMVGVDVPVLVQSIAFSSIINIQIKTMAAFPFAKTVSVSFPTHPDIQFVLKPLKGMDIMDLPGLSQFLHSLIRDTVAWLFVAPNAFTLDLDALMNGPSTLESAEGVLLIKIYEARGLKNVETVGKSDPYTEIKLGGRACGRTRVIDDNLDPYWNESFYVLVNSLNDILELNVFDKDLIKDRSLGSCRGPLTDFGLSKEQTKTDDIVRPLKIAKGRFLSQPTPQPIGEDDLNGSKTKGEIHFELSYYCAPVPNSPEAISNLNSCLSGVLRINIHQAKALDESKSMVGAYNPFVEVRQGAQLLYKTRVKKRTNTPQWEESFEVFIRDVNRDRVKFTIRDQRDLAVDISVGDCEIQVRHIVDMIRAHSTKVDWWTLRNVASGQIRLTFQYRPVMLDHPVPPLSSTGRQSYTPAIGVIRLKLIEADDLKNMEAVGTSDPYVKVTYAGKLRARTAVINSNLSPMWNETYYILLQDTTLKGKFTMEVYDFNNVSNDRFMGKVVFDLKSLLKRPKTTDIFDTWLSLTNESGKKSNGRLRVQFSYYPAIIATGLPTSHLPSVPEHAAVESTTKDSKPDAPEKTVKQPVPTERPKTASETPSIHEGDDQPKSSRIAEQLEYLKKHNAGIVRIMFHACEMDIEAAENLGYDDDRKPNLYFEFLDTNGAMVSNQMCVLMDSGPTRGDSMGSKTNLAMPKRFQRKYSKDFDALFKSYKDDDVAKMTNLTLLHRSVAVKDSVNPVYEEEVEIFVKDMENARLVMLCKDRESSSAIPNLNPLGLGGKQSTESLKENREIKQEKAGRHPILGKADISLRDTLEAELTRRLKQRQFTLDTSLGHESGSESITGKKNVEHDVHRIFSLNPSSQTTIGKFTWTLSFSPVELDEDLLFNEQALDVTRSGLLNVEIIEAKNLPAVDSSGTSDPYCRFRLNGDVLYKTKTIKKNNINPQWNEKFSSKLSSRANSRIVVEVRDWNQFEENKLLGRANLDCSELEVDEEQIQTLALLDDDGNRVGDSDGKAATLTLRVKFLPDSGTSGKRRRINRKMGHTDSVASDSVGNTMSTVAIAAKILANSRKKAASKDNIGVPATTGSPTTPLTSDDEKAQPRRKSEKLLKTGTLTIHVLEARDLKISDPQSPPDPLFKIRYTPDEVGIEDSHSHHFGLRRSASREMTLHKSKPAKKTVNPEWNESVLFPVAVNPEDPLTLHIDIRSHTRIGHGEELGEYDLDVWKGLLIEKATPLTDSQVVQRDFWTSPGDLKNGGNGCLHIRLEFVVNKKLQKLGGIMKNSSPLANSSANDENSDSQTLHSRRTTSGTISQHFKQLFHRGSDSDDK